MRARLLALAWAMISGLMIFGATGAKAQGTQFFAVLNGGSECVPTGTCRKGDLDAAAFGSATVILIPGASPKLCWAILVTGIGTPTAAHIHTGTAGIKGAIKIGLTPPAAGNPGASSGCMATTSTVINQIKANPTGFYVNVHNAEFVDGAVRGQLF
jgi:hypothetical protein